MHPVTRTYASCIDIAEDEGGGTTTSLITNTQQSAQNGLKSNKKCRPQPIRPKGTKEYIVSSYVHYQGFISFQKGFSRKFSSLCSLMNLL